MGFFVESGQFGWDYEVVCAEDESQTLYIQSDWEYAGLASSMGWCPCECGFTDGTVDCEHRKVGDMLAEAQEWIDDHLGEVFEDPGYFEYEGDDD